MKRLLDKIKGLFALMRRNKKTSMFFILCCCLILPKIPGWWRNYDYVFHIPEVNIYMYTKKQWGGKFLVMFSDKKYYCIWDRSKIDHIKVRTGDISFVSMMFIVDTKKIYINTSSRLSMNIVKHDINMISGKEWEFIFRSNKENGQKFYVNYLRKIDHKHIVHIHIF